MDSKALNRKKNEDYEKFLNITNRKPAIFRDIIIESECMFPAHLFLAFQSDVYFDDIGCYVVVFL
jgi:hypothetical protein